MNKKVAIILINYKDYAEKYFAACFNSLLAQDYLGEMKFFIVDNESSDVSFKYLQDNAPKAEIIRNEKNDGFAKGNNDAIKLALAQEFDYVSLFNMDTVVEKDCIKKMVEAINNPPNPLYQGGEIGAVQARMMLWDDKEKINSLGNMIHFLGFGYCEGYGEKFPISNFQFPIKDICYPSGAAVIFTREALEKVGLFDEELWMYNEDEDLGWRLWLSGYKCVLANNAIVYHKYEFLRSIQKYYWLDRNRMLVILKNYHWATLLLILPALLVMELGLFVFSLSNGLFGEKLKVYNYFLSIKNINYIWEARKKSQALRKVKDRDIIKMFSGRIWYQEIGGGRLKIANVIFGVYWKIIKVIIRW